MRMSYTWKRTVRAIAVTSSTTSVAFIANAFSPLMPMKAFGIYAAVIIPTNFLFVVMIFPAAVIYYEKRWEKYAFGRCWCKKLKNGQTETKENEKVEDAENAN